MNGKLNFNRETDNLTLFVDFNDKQILEDLDKKTYSDLIIERSLLQRSLMKKTRALEIFYQENESVNNANFVNLIHHRIDQEERKAWKDNLKIQELLIKSLSAEMDVFYTTDVKNRKDLNKIFKIFDEINELAEPIMDNKYVQEIIVRANHALHFKSLRMMRMYLTILEHLDLNKTVSDTEHESRCLQLIKIMSNEENRKKIYQEILILRSSIEEMDKIFISLIPNNFHITQ